MTTYHRGRVRSPYRKHNFTTLLSLPTSAAIQKVALHGPPSDGLVKIKSVRCVALLKGLGSTSLGGGWLGYARSSAADSSPDFAINQSDVFGVQEFVIGPNNDQIVALPLKGITLAVGERWWLCGSASQSGGSTPMALIASMVYAVETTDAT